MQYILSPETTVKTNERRCTAILQINSQNVTLRFENLDLLHAFVSEVQRICLQLGSVNLSKRDNSNVDSERASLEDSKLGGLPTHESEHDMRTMRSYPSYTGNSINEDYLADRLSQVIQLVVENRADIGCKVVLCILVDYGYVESIDSAIQSPIIEHGGKSLHDTIGQSSCLWKLVVLLGFLLCT